MAATEEKSTHFLKLNSKIFRNTQIYLDKALKKYGLGSGAYPYFFYLEQHEGVCQNKLSREIGNDKAMSARTVAKLIGEGFISKTADEHDSRACKLYLTEKGRAAIPAIRREIETLLCLITQGLSAKDQALVTESMKLIYDNTLKLNKGDI